MIKNKILDTSSKQVAYKYAGVDIEAGNELVRNIGPLAKGTQRPGAFTSLGGFGALFDLKTSGYDDPILVAATDGVGTKLKIAIETGNLKTVGIDLVAMCVNDLICQGAEPLFFLDYFATAKLNVAKATSVIEGIAIGCKIANISLIGGETAEMPDMYHRDDFDLAGFAVGALNRGQNLPKGIRLGDLIIGIHSSGVHSNGFSLVRLIVKNLGLSWQSIAPFSDNPLGTELLKPTKIYVRPVLDLKIKGLINGVAHITGGGLTENIPRILGKSHGAKIDLDKLIIPEVFKWLLTESKITEQEALKTFNCGTGMILIVKKDNVNQVQSILKQYNEVSSVIGEITSNPGIEYIGSLNVDE